jgi:protocatechuate 3,4-dioxygenase beta subunit
MSSRIEYAKEGVTMSGKRYGFTTMAVVLLLLCHAAGTPQPVNAPDSNAPMAQITITGRATDSQHKPVAGAKVTLYQITHDEATSIPKVERIDEKVTETDGTYSFSLAHAADAYGAHFLIGRKEGLALGWIMERRQDTRRLDILLGEPRHLAGDVVDEEARPIPNAEVSIAFAGMGKAENTRLLAVPGFLTAQTDSHGHFLFANMPAEASFEFLVRKPGRVTLNTFAQTILSDSSLALGITQIAAGERRCQFLPGQEGIKLVLPAEARIEGMVIEKTTGRPVAGVRVTARAEKMEGGFTPPDPVTSAEDGTFQIGGLAAGNHTVQLVTTRGQTAEWVTEPVPVSLKADVTTSGIRLEVTKGGTIEVLVKSTDGQPVGRAAVRISHAQRKQYFGGSTNEDGLVRIRVPSGPYDVSEPFRPGYAMRIRNQQVVIQEGETRRVEFVLRVTPRVAGTVRDETGHPLAGVRIAVSSLGSPGTLTNAGGEFALDWNPDLLRQEDAKAVLVVRDTARNLAAVVEFDEHTGHLDLTLRRGVIVTGAVLNAEGKPLAGARIRVTPRPSDQTTFFGPIEEVTTGENGTFEINAIPPGRQYEIMATATGYGTGHASVHASNLSDGRQDVGQFRLLLADLSVSGVVVDSHDKPVADAMVRVLDRNSPRRDGVRTDADGKFLITGVSAGTLLLMADTDGPTFRHGFIEVNGGATNVRIVVSE